jgi:lipoprotein-anchoring transpeptidase ErfK/SrfK
LTGAAARRRLGAAAAAAAIASGAVAGCGGSASPAVPRHPGGGSGLTPPPRRDAARAPAPLGLHTASGEDLGARLTAAAMVRDRPGGAVVARLGRRTEFGSPRILPVVRRRRGWLGVVTAALPNGRLGWIAQRRATLVSEPVRVRISLGRRLLTVLRGRRTLLRMPVGIGAPGTPTPTGRFAVTDGLTTPPGSPYGCCVLALSGHQPDIPQGWTGGDRIAVHGTTSPGTVGGAYSHGCLRARDGDLRRLLRLATLGARVEIVS